MTSENRSDKKPQTICACAVEAKSEMEFQKEIRKDIDKNEIGTFISTVGKRQPYTWFLWQYYLKGYKICLKFFQKVCDETSVGISSDCDFTRNKQK